MSTAQVLKASSSLERPSHCEHGKQKVSRCYTQTENLEATGRACCMYKEDR
jgi:hypothetical protein